MLNRGILTGARSETRSLGLLLGPKMVQSVLGFSWYTAMSDLKWEVCGSDS